jgi:predicted nucleotidyltransferase
LPELRKRKLGQVERKKVLSSLSEITDKSDVDGVCIYGSQVTGYAKPDSDYDLIIAIKNYNSRVRYRYSTGEIEISAILVDTSSLKRDASNASLGEFVIGRFLNPYEPITGFDLFREVERVYKRRVILETLDDLLSEYGEFVEDLKIPLQYFLFEKLRRRAAIYPPASYSYSQTYGGINGSENLERSTQGFREALEELESTGAETRRIGVNDDGSISVLDVKRRRQFGRIKTAFSGTQRGIRQYAVHGYAGRVRPSVVRKELLSKIARARGGRGEPPPELKDPKSLLKIGEGELLVEGSDWLPQLLEKLDIDENPRVTTQKLGSSCTLYSVSTGRSRPRKLVAKRFRNATSMRQLFSNLRSVPSKSWEFTPLARLHREYSQSRGIRSRDILTPKTLAIVLPERIIVREFLEGTDLGSTIALGDQQSRISSPVRAYGLLLSRIHKRGFALGDSRPDNVISLGRQLHILDWEHAALGGDVSWDISEFLYSSLRNNPSPVLAKSLIRSFFEGYFFV